MFIYHTLIQATSRYYRSPSSARDDDETVLSVTQRSQHPPSRPPFSLPQPRRRFRTSPPPNQTHRQRLPTDPLLSAKSTNCRQVRTTHRTSLHPPFVARQTRSLGTNPRKGGHKDCDLPRRRTSVGLQRCFFLLPCDDSAADHARRRAGMLPGGWVLSGPPESTGRREGRCRYLLRSFEGGFGCKRMIRDWVLFNYSPAYSTTIAAPWGWLHRADSIRVIVRFLHLQSITFLSFSLLIPPTTYSYSLSISRLVLYPSHSLRGCRNKF